MAKVTTRMVVTEVALVMSADEAETLRIILQHIGGDPQLSRRRHADSLLAALSHEGIKKYHNYAQVSGGVYFANEEQ